MWRFYNHRADCERVFRTGKQALGLGNLVGRSYAANATAFLLRALAFNIDLLFQQAAENRANLPTTCACPARHVTEQTHLHIHSGTSHVKHAGSHFSYWLNFRRDSVKTPGKSGLQPGPRRS